MIYFLICTKVVTGEPTGCISDLLQDVWTDKTAAERGFHDLELTREFIVKQLWVKEPGGRRYMLLEEKYE